VQQTLGHLLPDPLITADDYLGEAKHIVAQAVRSWTTTTPLTTTTPIAELATNTEGTLR